MINRPPDLQDAQDLTGLWGGYSEAQRATARSALAKGVPVSVVLQLGETTGRAA